MLLSNVAADYATCFAAPMCTWFPCSCLATRTWPLHPLRNHIPQSMDDCRNPWFRMVSSITVIIIRIYNIYYIISNLAVHADRCGTAPGITRLNTISRGARRARSGGIQNRVATRRKKSKAKLQKMNSMEAWCAWQRYSITA